MAEAKTVLVKNNALHHRGIPSPKGSGLPAILLWPGMNKVDEAAWNKAKELAVIQALLEAEPPVLVEIKASKTSNKPARDISQLKTNDAVKAVKDTVDPDLLAAWREGASGPVLKAIDDQLEALRKDK